MPKIANMVVYSDHHAHPHKDKATILANGRNSRLQDGLYVLDDIHKEQCDGFIFCGDMFHNRKLLDIDAFNEVFKRVESRAKECPYFLLVGNHDLYTKSGEIHSLASFGAGTVIDRPKWVVQKIRKIPIAIYGIPYSDDNEWVVEQIEEGINNPAKGVRDAFKILMIHQGINGAKISSTDVYRPKTIITLGNLQASEWDLVLAGHYHIPQKLAHNVYHVGATHQHGWVDANEPRGYWRLSIAEEDGEYEWLMEEKTTDTPQFYAVDDVRDLPDLCEGDFLRMVVPEATTLEELPEMNRKFFQGIIDGGVDVEFHHKPVPKEEQQRLDVDVSMSMEEILRAYIRSQDMESTDKEELLRIGLELLDT